MTGCVAGAALLLALTAAPASKAQDSVAPPVASPAPAAVASAAAVTNVQLAPVRVEADGVAKAVSDQLRQLDRSRSEFLLPPLGASAYVFDRDSIDALPRGKDTPIDKILLRAPGVSYDSAVSNPDFHVRNEYANVQYRINGIELPDGLAGFGSVLESAFIGRVDLLDGALPAQYGRRTAGVVDIATPSEFVPVGSASLTAGSQGTLSPAFEYGGTHDHTQYFGTLRYMRNDAGLENPAPGTHPLHDRTDQAKAFGFASQLLGDGQRLTTIGGATVGRFQIPNLPGQVPLGDYGGPNASSASLDENEHDSFAFGVAALQTKGDAFDTQFSTYVRYAQVHFLPDIAGDLAFNDVASNVMHRSLLGGVQFDGAFRLNLRHTLRGGFAVDAEHTSVDTTSTVLPLGTAGEPLPTPLTIADNDHRVGWNLGAYLQDEWRLANALTLNSGLRIDWLKQFARAHQFSPRVALLYQPDHATRAHIGFARYFTPPMQAQATPARLALFANTTQQSVTEIDTPARPERSNYLDVGVEHSWLNGWSAGVDIYYKRATDLLDDGQFGQAALLTQLNYAHAFSRGIEFKAAYAQGGLRAYANVSANQTMARAVVSNQYLFTDAAEYQYVNSHDFYSDDDQFLTASAGASYRSEFALLSLDVLAGSGLRSGFANQQHGPGYAQWNVAVAHEFALRRFDRPLTARLSVLNLLDRSYALRDGSGIGVFAPQYGPRRGIFITLSQAL